ncbi:MAG TPA: hypothetical protein VF212_17980 [Longimicrobiales bacterium]
MNRKLRILLAAQAAAFTIAALVHGGALIAGYEHREARIAETVIATALAAGLLATWLWPARAARIATVVQAFALLGTLVGLFTIAVGVGPRTVPDIVYHIAIVGVLAWGVGVAVRAGRGQTA